MDKSLNLKSPLVLGQWPGSDGESKMRIHQEGIPLSLHQGASYILVSRLLLQALRAATMALESSETTQTKCNEATRRFSPDDSNRKWPSIGLLEVQNHFLG